MLFTHINFLLKEQEEEINVVSFERASFLPWKPMCFNARDALEWTTSYHLLLFYQHYLHSFLMIMMTMMTVMSVSFSCRSDGMLECIFYTVFLTVFLQQQHFSPFDSMSECEKQVKGMGVDHWFAHKHGFSHKHGFACNNSDVHRLEKKKGLITRGDTPLIGDLQHHFSSTIPGHKKVCTCCQVCDHGLDWLHRLLDWLGCPPWTDCLFIASCLNYVSFILFFFVFLICVTASDSFIDSET